MKHKKLLFILLISATCCMAGVVFVIFYLTQSPATEPNLDLIMNSTPLEPIQMNDKLQQLVDISWMAADLLLIPDSTAEQRLNAMAQESDPVLIIAAKAALRTCEDIRNEKDFDQHYGPDSDIPMDDHKIFLATATFNIIKYDLDENMEDSSPTKNITNKQIFTYFYPLAGELFLLNQE